MLCVCYVFVFVFCKLRGEIYVWLLFGYHGELFVKSGVYSGGGSMSDMHNLREITCPSCAAVVRVYAGQTTQCAVCEAPIHA